MLIMHFVTINGGLYPQILLHSGDVLFFITVLCYPPYTIDRTIEENVLTAFRCMACFLTTKSRKKKDPSTTGTTEKDDIPFLMMVAPVSTKR